MKRLLLPLFLLLTAAVRVDAQAVEVREPFDSAGRVMEVTPLLAAQLQLTPPAWRITGDYIAARLFATGEAGYVIVVERRDGVSERYAITRQDREYLRARTATLPPGLVEEQLNRVTTGVTTGITAAREEVVRAVRNDQFVLHQGLLALTVYGPSFAYALSNETPGRVAAYVLGAGGTFYAATQLARDRTITGPQNILATHTALHGAGIGLGLAYGADANSNIQGLATFMGGVGGTALALTAGPRLRTADVAGAVFGADASLLMTYLLLRAGHDPDKDFPTRTEAAFLAAGTAVGYPLGMQYARMANYNVTPGDVGVLWTTGAVGALAAGTIAKSLTDDDGDNGRRTTVYSSAAAGFLLGAAAGDVLLVRRFDHTGYEAGLLALGAGGGALMGAGAYTLFDDNRTGEEVEPYVAATAGAILGLALAEAFLPPGGDAGRQAKARVEVNPLGVALAASRSPGHHSFVRITF
jgi:hypothetical protein